MDFIPSTICFFLFLALAIIGAIDRIALIDNRWRSVPADERSTSRSRAAVDPTFPEMEQRRLTECPISLRNLLSLHWQAVSGSLPRTMVFRDLRGMRTSASTWSLKSLLTGKVVCQARPRRPSSLWVLEAAAATTAPGLPERMWQLIVSYRGMILALADEPVVPHVVYHPEVWPHHASRLIFAPYVLADMLHAIHKVAIWLTSPRGFEGHVVAEPAHDLVRVLVVQVPFMMLDPLVCVVDAKDRVAVLYIPEFAP